MRVNVYAEEMTDIIEIVEKIIDGVKFTGVRFYLYLPVTVRGKAYEEDGKYYDGKVEQIQGPFIHRARVEGKGIQEDDDSSAITFWGKSDLRVTLRKALTMLDDYYILHGKGMNIKP
jgi:hypothetical protein